MSDTKKKELEAQWTKAYNTAKSILAEEFDKNNKDGLDESKWAATQRDRYTAAMGDVEKFNTQIQEIQFRENEQSKLDAMESQAIERNRANRNGTDGNAGGERQKTAPSEFQKAIEYREALGHTNVKNSFYDSKLNRYISAEERQAWREAGVAYIKYGRAAATEKLMKGGFTGEEVRVITGADRTSASEQQLLTSTTGELGGFSFGDDFRNELVRPRPGFAAVRMAGARTMPTNSDVLVMPRIVSGTDPYSSGVSGAWRADGYVSGGTAPSTQNQPTLAQERVQVHWWQPNAIEMSPNLLMDNAVNLESVIGEELGRTKSLDEDSAFINGSGVGQPLGLTTALGTAYQVTLGNDAVSYATLINLIYGVPAQYRGAGAHIMSSQTYADYMKLETSSGVTLIYPGYARQQANNATPGVANLQGYPVYFSEFMSSLTGSDDVGTNLQLFGDFYYYVIAERQELTVQRLVEKFAPNIGLLVAARVGGQPVLYDAFRMGVVG